MKSSQQVLKYSFLAVSMSALVAGCGGGGGGDTPPKTVEVVETPAQPVLKQAYKYQIVLQTQLDGSLITDELEIKFQGSSVDNNRVVDAANQSVKGKTFKTTSGTFAIAANLTGDEFFTVVAGNREKGWQETGVQVTKSTSSEGTNTLVLKLVNTKDVAAINADTSVGLSINTQAVAKTDTGAVTSATAPVVLTANSKVVTNAEGVAEPTGTATVTLPANVNAVDSTGKKINLTNGVSLTVVKFSNAEANSLSAFPGGFAPAVETATGSTRNDGAFISGGFAQFNLTDNATGQPLKQFDKDLELAIDLPKTSKSPTGAALTVGDTYPVWSFDETKGTWKFEADGVIAEKTPVDPNNFTVKFKANHLSYWNLDFYENTCTANLTLNRSAQDKRPLTVELIGAVGSRFYSRFSGVTDSAQTFARYPAAQRVFANVYDQNGTKLAGTTAVNLCNGASLNIPAPPQAVTNLVVNVTESCPSGTNKRPLSTFVNFAVTPFNLLTGWRSAYGSSVSFSSLNVGTSGTLVVASPRGSVKTQIVSNITSNQIIEVNFNDLQCEVKPVTGGTGSGG